jgi:hypothetical protein
MYSQPPDDGHLIMETCDGYYICTDKASMAEDSLVTVSFGREVARGRVSAPVLGSAARE